MREQMTCLDFQNQLDALVQGTIQGSERARLLAHVDDCQECRMMLAVERHVTSLSPAGFEDQVPDRMVREMWPAIRSRLGTTAPVQRTRWFRWFMPSLAAAAAALLFLSGILYGENRQLRRQLADLSIAQDHGSLSLPTTESGYATGFQGITFAASRWRHELPYHDEFTVAELLGILDGLPKTTVLLRGEDITAVSQSYPMWRSLLGDDRERALDAADGIQAGEAIRLIESMDLPASFRIRASRLATLTQPLRSYRNMRQSTLPKED